MVFSVSVMERTETKQIRNISSDNAPHLPYLLEWRCKNSDADNSYVVRLQFLYFPAQRNFKKRQYTSWHAQGKSPVFNPIDF